MPEADDTVSRTVSRTTADDPPAVGAPVIPVPGPAPGVRRNGKKRTWRPARKPAEHGDQGAQGAARVLIPALDDETREAGMASAPCPPSSEARPRPDAVLRPHILLILENIALGRDRRLTKQAEALLAAGYRVSVICRSDPRNRDVAGMTLYEYRAPRDGESKLGFVREYGWAWAMAAWLTARVFLTDAFDAIQISGNPDIYFAIGAPFKLLGRPLVVDQRDLSPELFESRFGKRGRLYRILRWLERTNFRTSDHVVTVNGSLRDVVRTRGGVAADAITVIGNGPRLKRTAKRPKRVELRRGRRYLACWIGLMGPQDHVDLALRAIHHLVHEMGRQDCHFAFIGDGETRAACERLAAELQIDDWVEFTGWLDEEEVYSYLSTADVGIDPNLDEMVSPVKGMEYMAFGVPFVAFDLREARVLAEGAAGYATPGDVVGFATRLDDLLADPGKRASMGAAGRRILEERVAWECQEAAYVEVFRGLLERRGRAVPASPSRPDVKPQGQQEDLRRRAREPAGQEASA